jgi:hypothetical protein
MHPHKMLLTFALSEGTTAWSPNTFVSVAVKNRSRLAADWSLSVLSLSLLERGGFLERPAAVKGALLLRGEANP